MTIANVHVTGSNGFVGSNLCRILSDRYKIEGSGRGIRSIGNLTNYATIDWRQSKVEARRRFNQIDAVIHCAGLAHETDHQSTFEKYFDANVKATCNVFSEAISCGVKKFIYISSIAVYDVSGAAVSIDDMSLPSPKSVYGKTKFIAEQELLKMAQISSVELVIIRPPMVIGSGAPGNLKKLLGVLKLRIPFPVIYGNVHRSFVTVDSLARFCDCVLDSKEIVEPLIVNLANAPAVTLSGLVGGLRRGLGIKMINIAIPRFVLAWAMHILGLSETYQKVFSTLSVKPSSAAIDLGWDPYEDWSSRLYEIGQSAAEEKMKESEQ